ncbi:MAG: transglycosylase domain-containing protein, partial [Elusimicrobiota bacterium]|nr:transglycosylase domain-containing protein [Elusimicrobiota bacterium]
YIKELPSIDQFQEYKPNLTTKVYDINNKLIDEIFIEKRNYVEIQDVPQDLVNAIIATEDNNFYQHWGFSAIGFTRAFIKNVFSGKISQGGSTLTQQLAKLLFLTREKKISRKIKELILSIRLEMKYSKNEILKMYFNHIYLGHGIYGVSLAAEYYFGKTLQELELQEIALLAGLPKAPEYYSPFKNLDIANSRKNLVLSRMLKSNFITQERYDEAVNKAIVLTERVKREKYASYFIELIRIQLEEKYGDMLYKGGLKVYTTLDFDMQMAAFQAIENNLSKFDEMKKEKIIKYLETGKLDKYDEDLQRYNSIDEYNNIQGALISLDVKTGQVRALVGGRDFKKSQFNRVYQAKRQAGSSFKPIIFTAAIAQGIPPNLILKDEPVIYYNDGISWQLVGRTDDFSDVPPEIFEKFKIIEKEKRKKKNQKYDPLQVWTPKNYTRKYYGNITLRQSLEKSVNIPSIKLLEKVGPNIAATFAKKMGIDSHVSPYLSMVLGAFEVTPLELTRAYGTLANLGVKTKPYVIAKICDNDDKILEENFPKEEVVLSEQTAYIMTNLLRGVVENGTGRIAKRLGVPVAAKTGTTNDSSDAWFIGYTPDIVTTVWVGYDEMISIGGNVVGANLAGPIWVNYMKEIIGIEKEIEKDKKHSSNFKLPNNIAFVPINKKTGLKSLELNDASYLEAFIVGTEPDDFSIYSEMFYDDLEQGEYSSIENETETENEYEN